MNFKTIHFLQIIFLFSFLNFYSNGFTQNQGREIYELKIYHLDNRQQEERVDSYLKSAYIPAIHQAGVGKVGVFKPIEGDSLFGKRIFVLTPYQSAEQLFTTPQALENDKKYSSAGKDYLEATHDNPPYQRMVTIVMQAFEGFPQLQEPNLKRSRYERIYELRSYESATEKLFQNKVEMFNKGEIDIFKNLGYNIVFFGEVVAGPDMPNLIYMTAFEDRTSRDAHWKAFSADPAWKKMSALKQYQNNVSHIDTYLLHAAPYSDI
jgi:hypothetical protein